MGGYYRHDRRVPYRPISHGGHDHRVLSTGGQ